jgi:hexokinase
LDEVIFDNKSDYQPLPVVEIGGTNLNISIVNLGSKEIIKEYESCYIFEENRLSVKYLFEKIAGILETMLENEEYRNFAQIGSIQEVKQIGIVLAFPISYKYYDAGKFGSILTSHSKEIDVSEVMDKDLTLELRKYWKQELGTDINLIIVNDAIASVFCLKYLNTLKSYNFDYLINVIVGTGFNIAFESFCQSQLCYVNSESGFLPIIELQGLTDFDQFVNQQSMISTNFVEQMVSGKYVPVLLNHILGMISSNLQQFESLEEYMEYIKPSRMNVKSDNVHLVKKLINYIFERGSEIVAEALIAVVSTLKEASNILTPKVAFLFEGSVLNKTSFHTSLENKLKEKLGPNYKLTIIDKIFIDHNRVTTRFSSIGTAYLLYKLL